ncbi:LamG domain-containing protein, partial [Nanoarchaeota archaeon]
GGGGITQDSADDGGGGAGYGGEGGNGGYSGTNNAGAGGSSYGSLTQPIDLGSGGSGGQANPQSSYECTDGESGGGLIFLNISGTLNNSGVISSDGNNASNTITGWHEAAGGGGSGGSVYIIASTISGDGSITADGGNGGSVDPADQGGEGAGGGAGGGRIAIHCDNLFAGTISVLGGSGGTGSRSGAAQNGQNGTIYDGEPEVNEFPTAYGTTNFVLESNLSKVYNLTLANQRGKIRFNGTQEIKTKYQDYDTYVEIGVGFVSVNASGLDGSFNETVNITINNVDCDSDLYYGNNTYNSRNDIMTLGYVCNESTDPACTNIACSDGTLTFTASHFTGYATNAFSNLTIWDETDEDEIFGNQTVFVGDLVKFFANYTNSSGDSLSGANCSIYFSDTGWNNMSWNSSHSIYEYNRSFSTNGTFNWNVSCNHTGYGSINTNDTVFITGDIYAPAISFVDPTPDDEANTTDVNVTVNVSITNASDLEGVIWNWNGTNYTMYNDSLVFMLNLNNNSDIGENSSYAVDTSIYGNNCTFGNDTPSTQPNWTADGKYLSAVAFDGIINFLSCGNDTSLNFTGNLTIEAWMKTNATNKLRQRIVGKKNAFAFGISYDEVIFTGPSDTESINANLQPNTWYHVAVTIDNINASFYVNGELNTNNSHNHNLSTSNEPLSVGDARQWSEEEFNGTIDEVRIYNRVLTPSEIEQNYYSNLRKYESDKWIFFSNQTFAATRVEENISYYGCGSDDIGNLNCTGSRNIIILDTGTPNSSVIETNNSDPKKSETIFLNWTVIDNDALSGTWLQIQNGSGTYNTSVISVSGTEDIANYTYTINDPRGTVLNFTVFVNDTTNNIGTSSALQINVSNTKPTQSAPQFIASDTPLNTSSANLIVGNVSTNDVDGDYVRNIYSWFVDNESFAIVNLPFEGNNGNESTTAIDYSGNDNDGNVTSATWNRTGGYGGRGAYEFDGFNDKIELEDGDIIINSSFTICAWANARDAENNTIFSTQGTNQSLTFLLLRNDTLVTLGVANDTDNICSLSIARSPGYWSGWHHYCVSFNDSNVSSLYIDGIYQTSKSCGSQNIRGNLTIGRMKNYDDEEFFFYNGSIDEFMVFNRSLSLQQIQKYVTNQTNIISSEETTRGEVWSVNVTPNDGYEDGTSFQTNVNITVQNSPPTQSTPILNATDHPGNRSEANLTVYNQSSSDEDDDSIKNIFNWFVNGTSLAILNMPFEAHSGNESVTVLDYSGFDNEGSVGNDTVSSKPVWSSMGGYDGRGAYEFDGIDDFINLSSLSGEISPLHGTISAWIKTNHGVVNGVPTDGNNHKILDIREVLNDSDRIVLTIDTSRIAGAIFNSTGGTKVGGAIRIRYEKFSE